MIIESQIDNEIRERLLEARSQGNLVIFFGAGVSQEGGYPNWKKLTQQLIEVIKRDPTAKESLASGFDAMQTEWSLDILDVIKKTNRPYFQECYRKIFPQSRSKYRATQLGKQIASLNTNRFVTLNYDVCFQSALVDIGVANSLEMTLKTLDIPALDNPTAPLICQVHGSAIEGIDDIILTKSQYNIAYRYGSSLYNFLDHVFRNYHLIIVGYGFNDDRINELLESSNAYSETTNHNLRIGIRGYTKEEETNSPAFCKLAKHQWDVDVLEYRVTTNGVSKDHSDIDRAISGISEIVGSRFISTFSVQPDQLERDIVNK